MHYEPVRLPIPNYPLTGGRRLPFQLPADGSSLVSHAAESSVYFAGLTDFPPGRIGTANSPSSGRLFTVPDDHLTGQQHFQRTMLADSGILDENATESVVHWRISPTSFLAEPSAGV